MFIGHFAVGLAAKRAAPSLSLGTLFIACQLLDLIWPVLVLAGVEHVRVDHSATAFTPFDFLHYPWSHSLLMTLVWGALMFAVLKLRKKKTVAAIVAALSVASHWLLDVTTHRPDMPLAFGETKLGLGLWQSVAATIAVETTFFAIAAWMYARGTNAKNKRGTWVYGSLIAFLTVAYLANAFGPRPPEDMPPAAIAGPALSMWLIVAWAYWADRNRTSTK